MAIYVKNTLTVRAKNAAEILAFVRRDPDFNAWAPKKYVRDNPSGTTLEADPESGEQSLTFYTDHTPPYSQTLEKLSNLWPEALFTHEFLSDKSAKQPGQAVFQAGLLIKYRIADLDAVLRERLGLDGIPGELISDK